jgi:hypothetical protein
MEEEIKNKKTLLQFWEEQMKHSSTSSNYFFRKISISLSYDVTCDVCLQDK